MIAGERTQLQLHYFLENVEISSDGSPGLSVMRRVPRPRVLRAGLGSRLSLSKRELQSYLGYLPEIQWLTAILFSLRVFP